VATAVYGAISASNEVGTFSVSITYDTGTLRIQSATVINTTGQPQAITVSSFTTSVAAGTNATVSLLAANIFMVNTPRGPRPPVFIG
jgi:hypothetical protein